MRHRGVLDGWRVRLGALDLGCGDGMALGVVVPMGGFRRTAGTLKERPLEDVALREIATAMVHVAGHAMGITEDELLKETFRVFGGNRVTPVVHERLARALAVRDRRLSVVEGVVVPDTCRRPAPGPPPYPGRSADTRSTAGYGENRKTAPWPTWPPDDEEAP